MHFPKLTNVVTICRSILEGRQIHIVVQVKEPPEPTTPPSLFVQKYRGIDTRYSYQIEAYVRTSRRRTTKWASIPVEIPDGTYVMTLRRK